ncbi:hypothetical protein D9M70_588950 [compost metagenome]
MPDIPGLFDQSSTDGNTLRRTHDSVVEHHHSDSGPSDGIHVDVSRALAGADTNAVAYRLVHVLRGKVVELALGNADQQYRLMVLQHPDATDMALQVDTDQCVDGFA